MVLKIVHTIIKVEVMVAIVLNTGEHVQHVEVKENLVQTIHLAHGRVMATVDILRHVQYVII